MVALATPIGNHGALVGLNTALGAFHNVHTNFDCIPNVDLRNVFLHVLFLNHCNNVGIRLLKRFIRLLINLTNLLKISDVLNGFNTSCGQHGEVVVPFDRLSTGTQSGSLAASQEASNNGSRDQHQAGHGSKDTRTLGGLGGKRGFDGQLILETRLVVKPGSGLPGLLTRVEPPHGCRQGGRNASGGRGSGDMQLLGTVSGGRHYHSESHTSGHRQGT
mmetsp:Transcript_32614/g.58481  ORF Transcript_32614/g.58481 Transcript_32614/m.58481 type:complete len:218 (+) Transcript_32614:751-1404(+)